MAHLRHLLLASLFQAAISLASPVPASSTATTDITQAIESIIEDIAAGIAMSPSYNNQASTTTQTTKIFQPKAGATWNIQLLSPPNITQADDTAYHVWDMDLYDTPNATIEAFKAKGHPVICYFSAGSYEDWRSDAKDFPKEASGKSMDGWHGEKWVDTRNEGVREIMKKRIELAKEKGCDGVDPDNIDGYKNDTGFPLTEDDGVDYVNFLSSTAHNLGLAYGLKNGGAIVPRVVDKAQWCIQEQCVVYGECDQYQPFIQQGKPVFHLEYTVKTSPKESWVKKMCAPTGFSTLIKHLKLDDWTMQCD